MILENVQKSTERQLDCPQTVTVILLLTSTIEIVNNRNILTDG